MLIGAGQGVPRRAAPRRAGPSRRAGGGGGARLMTGGPSPLPIGRMRIRGGQRRRRKLPRRTLPLLPGPRHPGPTIPGPGHFRLPAPPPRATVPHPPKGPVSPYINPFRFGGVTGSRIDQGVDYSARPGTRIGALGRGRIIEAVATGSGWPGGGFIAERLTKGPARGQVVYTAEDVAPAVVTGQRVRAGQVIGRFTAGGSIESGWGTNPPGQALAYGRQSAPGPDPGAYSTGYGIAFDRLIRRLGGPAGVRQAITSGGAPPMFSATGGKPGRAGHVPAPGRVSLPPSIPAVVIPSGVHPAGGGGVRLMAEEMPLLLKRRRKPGGGVRPWPVIMPPVWLHKKPPPPVPPPQPVPVTVITSSKGKGGVAAPPPPAAASSGSGGTMLLLAGAAGIVLLIVLMRKGKGKGKGKGGRK